jgi:hypothetical protein
MPRTRASARPLTEHDEIRRWAEERNAKPAHVKRTGGGDDVGMIRLDFPGYSGSESLEEISWDDWFEKFDERNLALLVQEETAGGQKSNFNKLVSRDTATDSNNGRSSTRPSKPTKSQRGEEPAPAQEFSSDADIDEEMDVEEDVEVERRPAARRTRNASARGRARQGRSSARGRARKSSSARGGASRNSRSSARGQRSRSTARSSATKKPASRARGAQGSSSRSAGRRKAA